MIGEWMTRIFVAIGITSVVVSIIHLVVFRLMDTFPVDGKQSKVRDDDGDYRSVENVSKRLAETARIAAEDSEKLMRHLERIRAKRSGNGNGGKVKLPSSGLSTDPRANQDLKKNR